MNRIDWVRREVSEFRSLHNCTYRVVRVNSKRAPVRQVQLLPDS